MLYKVFIGKGDNMREAQAKNGFWGKLNPEELLKKYGSPLYVYNERIFRQKCRDMLNITDFKNFKPNYSIKANSNLALLRIAHDEGLSADAMSFGEIYLLLKAGFSPEDIFYVSNNANEEEFKYAIQNRVLISVDSVSQLELLGKIAPLSNVAIRFNPGIGAGHHAKVITAGKNTKFGVNPEFIPEIKEILKKYDLKLVGINQHIGSLFMEADPYLDGIDALLEIAKSFDNLEFIDIGGGFGVPYRKLSGEGPIDIKDLNIKLTKKLIKWANENNPNIKFKSEPGRYIVAESGALLGRATAIKMNPPTKYIGTDMGFNVLKRPTMYDSHHDMEVYREGELVEGTEEEMVTVVGNICETGDILAKDRLMQKVNEGDVIAVLDAGAYGFSMSSNYNGRLRPAEVLIDLNGNDRLIRRRDTLSDIINNMIF
jgi:diaminopimelate decarboxylase